MKRIKIKVREKLPETNSSSSHSVVICSKGNYLTKNDPEWDLDMDQDGVIRIPGNVNFGWEYEKYNDPLTKIQYVCGIFCRENNYSKKLKGLSEIIKKFTGASKIIYQWEEDFANEVAAGADPEDVYKQVPEIDHNSSDIFADIVEDSKTIKDFIFNPKSWLFLGNDNSSAPDGFYNIPDENREKSEPEAIFSIDLGTGIGRIDFEIPIFPCDIYQAFIESGGFEVLQTVGIKKTASGELESMDYEGMRGIPDTHALDDIYVFNNIFTKSYIGSGKMGIIFLSTGKFSITNEEVVRKSPSSPEYIAMVEDIVNNHPDKAIVIPIKITTKEFGDL